MTGLIDLSAHAPALTALAAQVEASAAAPTGLQMIAVEVLALLPALSGGPSVDTTDGGAGTPWSASVDADGMVVFGTQMQIFVDGPAIAPQFVHIVSGERALMVQAVGIGEYRVRLLDGTEVVSDVTANALGKTIDHLDTQAMINRLLDHVGRALDRRPDDPYESTGDEPLTDLGAPGGLGGLGGRTGVGRAAATVAGSGAVVAAAAAARGLAKRRSKTGEWTPTHVVPAGGLVSWPEPDANSTPTHVDAGVELRLEQHTGDWAECSATTGWTGWFDLRLLVSVA